MIAHLPADPITEQTPDPQALSHPQRETKRLIDMSRGVLQIFIGAACLVVAAISLQPWWPLPDPTVLLIVPFTILLPGSVFQYLIMRARKRAGIPKVTMRDNSLVPSHPWRFAAKLALAVALVALLSFLTLEGDSSPVKDALRTGVIALVVAVPMAWRAWRLGLWEHHLVAAGFLLGFAMVWATDGSQRIGWLCLVLGLAQLLAGYSLHRRWTAWVHTLNRNAEQDKPGATHAAAPEDNR
jgi:hypothetical protein